MHKHIPYPKRLQFECEKCGAIVKNDDFDPRELQEENHYYRLEGMELCRVCAGTHERVLRLTVYDDGAMIVKAKNQQTIRTHTNPETLTAMMLLGAVGSLGGRK